MKHNLDVMVSLLGTGAESHVIVVHDDDYTFFAKTIIDITECGLNVVISKQVGSNKKDVLTVDDMKMAFGYLMLKGRKKINDKD